MFLADTPTFLGDFGSATTWAPSSGAAQVTGLMIFDQPVEAIDGGDTLSRQYQATFASGEWPGLKRGEVLLIGGEGGNASYRLRTDPRAADDGVFATVALSKV